MIVSSPARVHHTLPVVVRSRNRICMAIWRVGAGSGGGTSFLAVPRIEITAAVDLATTLEHELAHLRRARRPGRAMRRRAPELRASTLCRCGGARGSCLVYSVSRSPRLTLHTEGRPTRSHFVQCMHARWNGDRIGLSTNGSDPAPPPLSTQVLSCGVFSVDSSGTPVLWADPVASLLHWSCYDDPCAL